MKPLESGKRTCPMDEHERFAKLYDVVLDIYRSYSANFVWTVGLLSLAAGWFISSDSSRAFIQGSSVAFLAAVLVVGVIGLIHSVGCWWFYRRSKDMITEITVAYDDLRPLPFAQYEIRASVLVLNLLVSWAVVAGLIAFLIAARAS